MVGRYLIILYSWFLYIMCYCVKLLNYTELTYTWHYYHWVPIDSILYYQWYYYVIIAKWGPSPKLHKIVVKKNYIRVYEFHSDSPLILWLIFKIRILIHENTSIWKLLKRKYIIPSKNIINWHRSLYNTITIYTIELSLNILVNK